VRPEAAAKLARAAGAGRRSAWRRLDGAGRQGDQVAVDAVWAEWFGEPLDPLWMLLDGWHRPAGGELHALSLVALGLDSVFDPGQQAAVVAAAGRAGHPVAETAQRRILTAGVPALVEAACAAAAAEPDGGLAAFCRQHRLAPADPTTRVMFFLLTGQDEHRRAADPDGALLAAGYAAAGPGERDRLRAAMVGAGDLDLLRVVAGDRAGWVARVDRAEAGYLVDQLVARRDWDRLWRLATEVSPAGAIGLIRRFPAGWRPGTDRDRRLHDALTAAPQRIEIGTRAIAAGRIRVAGNARDVAFGTDESRLAVVSHDGPWESGKADATTEAWVSVYDLPAAECRWRGRLAGPFAALSRVLPVGDRVLASTGLGSQHNHRLDRVHAGGRAALLTDLYFPTRPRPVPAGFVLTDMSRLLFGSADGEVTRAVRWPEISGQPDVSWSSLAADPGSGRLALGGRHLVVLDGAGRLLARQTIEGPAGTVGTVRLAFTEADRLVSYRQSTGVVAGWQVRRPSPGAPGGLVAGQAGLHCPHHPELAALPAHRLVLVDQDWHDSRTLLPVTGPAGLDPAGCRVIASPSGDSVALAGRQSVLVYRVEPAVWVTDLAHLPVVGARPADLGRVVAEQARAVRPEVRALLALLRACLEHRFGTDVELAASDAGIGTDYDVGL
jgi:hypothetical protein